MKRVLNKRSFVTINSLLLAFLILPVFSFFMPGCKKFVDIGGPVTSINAENAFENDRTAISVFNGFYSKVSFSNIFFGEEINSLSCMAGLSADELDLYDGITSSDYLECYRNSLTVNNSVAYRFWRNGYSTIYKINSAIEGLNKSTTLTDAIKQQLLGEAKFLRAFYYFYLINLYGEIPLVLTSDYKNNSSMERASESQVWGQIVMDLKEAQDLLSTNYLDVTLIKITTERVRPTKWSATALLARTYLYIKEYENAELQASAVIENSILYDTVPVNSAFLRNNKEAIWQLQPVDVTFNVKDAITFVIPPTGFNGESYPVYLSQWMINSFEPGDNRWVNWIGSYTDIVSVPNKIYYYPYKYKSYLPDEPQTEYSTVFRLAEQYLIRAEARARQANADGALKDLNIIRARAGLPESDAIGEPDIVAAILHERQTELFTEWGHRWFDLKRSEIIDDVMPVVTTAKGGEWSKYWQYYPIPAPELVADPNLKQNQGY